MLVLNKTNRQIELMSTTSTEISAAMTTMARAVQQSMIGETHTRHSFGRTQVLPKAPLEFRRQMLSFQAPVVTPNEKWKLLDNQGGFRRIFSLKAQSSMLESVRAREQLQAILHT